MARSNEEGLTVGVDTPSNNAKKKTPNNNLAVDGDLSGVSGTKALSVSGFTKATTVDVKTAERITRRM